MAKNIPDLVNELNPSQPKPRVKRDSYVARALKDPNVRNYGSGPDAEQYSDDELKELGEYIFDAYQFNEEDPNDDEYQGFYDHLLDNYGSLQYYRGSFGKPYKQASAFDKYSTQNQIDDLDRYLGGLLGGGYEGHELDWRTKQKLYDDARNSGIAAIKNSYKQKYGRDFTGSPEDYWRESAITLAQKYPDNAYLQNLAWIANDPNGVDHTDLIKELIKAFGFTSPRFNEIYDHDFK